MTRGHPFIMPEPGDGKPMCSVCGLGPCDPIHSPIGKCRYCKRTLYTTDEHTYHVEQDAVFCVGCDRTKDHGKDSDEGPS